MDDLFLKLRMFALCWPDVAYWWREVWGQEADQNVCCDGRECGCYGSSYGEMWEVMLRKPEQSQ